MAYFDYSEQNKEHYDAISKLPAELLEQEVQQDYPDGMKELEELISFIPENQRAVAIQGFIGAMLVT